LLLFDKILSTESTISDMMIQQVLAPLSVLHDDHSLVLETMRPLASHLMSLLLLTSEKLQQQQSHSSLGMSVAVHEGEIAERVCQTLTVTFLHGSQLARELTTAVNTSHLRTGSERDRDIRDGDRDNKAWLPVLLAMVGRAARLPNGAGYSLAAATLQLLSVIVTGCERATRQVLPSAHSALTFYTHSLSNSCLKIHRICFLSTSLPLPVKWPEFPLWSKSLLVCCWLRALLPCLLILVQMPRRTSTLRLTCFTVATSCP
jgi:hypothetical protein